MPRRLSMGSRTGARAGRLRAMTYNIRHAAGIDGRLDLPRIARVIRDAGVDLVGLQEVDRHYGERSRFVDQAGWLAEALGTHLAFGANIDLDPPAPGRRRRLFGTALLCVAPILEWDNVALLPTGGVEQRGLLRGWVEVGGVRWRVFVTHLEPDDPAARLAQARAAADLIGEPEHAVLLGDLNATADTTEVRVLAERLPDAWPAGQRFRATYRSPWPCRCIDHVLRSRGARTTGAAVVGSIRARLASDHLPVVVDLAVP